MLHFKSPINDLSELRSQFKALVKRFHPDCGGNEKDMVAVNCEYETLRDQLLSTGKIYQKWSQERKDKEVEID